MFGSKGRIRAELEIVLKDVAEAREFILTARDDFANEIAMRLWEAQKKLNRIIKLEDKVKEIVDKEL